MEYRPTFIKLCKPMYKLSIGIFRIGMLLLVIGLVIGLLGKGWLTILIACICMVVSIIINNIPTSYLANFLKDYDESITAKEATDIAQNHLKEPFNTKDDTISFVRGIIHGIEREKRKNKIH